MEENRMMAVPSRSQCLALMTRIGMPDHIRQHSLIVAQVALFLALLLNRNSHRLDLRLLEAGALLHDIAKAESLATRERHEDLGATMLENWGYPMLSKIVREHVVLEASALAGPITESLVVNYADKRVKHDQIVPLKERFSDLIGRYAKTGEHRQCFQSKFELYRRLETKLFEHLTIVPEDLSRLCSAASATIS